ncbi:MAG: S-layer homology domain-containing protein [Chloroflexota bacterium]|nr:S-layer homology domain-containing protein [Chloroflexota bacterium]
MRPSKHPARSIPSGLFLFVASTILVTLLVIGLPAPEGTAQEAAPSSTATPIPTSTSTPTATPEMTPVPLAPCETGWRIVPAPSVGAFRDVAAIAQDDVWVVGDSGAIHWDGASWSHVATAGVTNLSSISAVASDDVWATNGSAVIHWDGSTWSLDYDTPVKPENGSYSDLAAISADDVWLVGTYWPSSDYRLSGFSTHWNRHEWTVPSSIGSGTRGSMMIAVAGIPGGPVWATGHWLGPLLLNWTGDYWGMTYALDYGAQLLTEIEVFAPNDVWAVGTTTGNTSGIVHYDGSQWSLASSPDVGMLNSVSAAAPDDVWAVGEHGTLRWNGSEWTQVPAPRTVLTAVDALGSADVWAVGADVVLHYSSEPFWDVSQSNPFYSFVRCLACQEIVSGYSDGSFRPNERITRGQAAKIIANAANYSDEIPSDRQTFADVPPDSPFWLYIERVYAHEAIGGYPCGAEGELCPGIYYRPGAYLTRGQLAKIATNVAGYEDAPSGQTFNDVPPGSPFYTYIERAAAHDVISGYACGGTNPDTSEAEPCPGAYFRPASNVTRGQTAKIVANSLLPGCDVPTPTKTPRK